MDRGLILQVTKNICVSSTLQPREQEKGKQGSVHSKWLDKLTLV